MFVTHYPLTKDGDEQGVAALDNKTPIEGTVERVFLVRHSNENYWGFRWICSHQSIEYTNNVEELDM
jgi:hypothetical protein